MSRSLRQLAKTPSFTSTALATIAICVAANLTIFAVVDSVLLRPLPFREPDRLVTIYNTYPKAGVIRDGASLTNYYERRGQISAFSSVAEFRPDSAIVGEAPATDRMEIARVTPEFFSTLGMTPVIGREFQEGETTYQTDAVVILTDSFWHQHFQADPAILSRTLRIDGNAYRIVGVLPSAFSFLSSSAQLFVPLSSDPSQRASSARHNGNSITMIARLAPGVSLSEAQSQVSAHDAAIAGSYGQPNFVAESGFRSVVAPLHADHVARVRPILLFLQTGGLILLLIGVANLVNLLLVRTHGQARDLAIRRAMGATWRHLVGELLTVTCLLALLGGIAGILLAGFGLDLIRLLGADRLPLGARLGFDAQIAAIGMLGSLAIGLLAAVPLIWFTLRTPLPAALQSSSRTSTRHLSARRLQHSFIIAQLSLAFVLLSGATLLTLSLRRALAVSPGFQTENVISGQLSLPWRNYHGDALIPFTERLTTELSHLPGISAVGVATTLPFNSTSGLSAITVKGHARNAGQPLRGHHTYGIDGDYFRAMGIPLVRGRFIIGDDSHRTERSCVVDEAFARRYWPNGDALGQRLFAGSRPRSDTEAFTVVGVVGTIKQAELTETEALGTVYFPLSYRSDLQFFVVARTTWRPETIGPALQTAVRRLDAELPLTDLRTMSTRMEDTLTARRTPALLAGLFAGIALLLSAVGTYGVLSFSVAQREREIGVRMALGAQPAQIGRQFVGTGVRLLVAGAVLGAVGTWFAGRAMQAVLFDVPALPIGPLLFTFVSISSVALLASWLPARRAAKVDPVVALRAE
jgi:predicted permease